MVGNMCVVSVREARVTVCVFSSKELLVRIDVFGYTPGVYKRIRLKSGVDPLKSLASTAGTAE